MKKTILIIFLAIGITAQAQIFDKDYNVKSYAYFSAGSSYATTPHTNNFTPNGIVTAGVFWNVFDVSINFEYVDLEPDYFSYTSQVLVRPFTYRKFEPLIGLSYGRVIRVDEGTYNYFGVVGEIRYNISKFFVSLTGDYSYRGDIRYVWGDNSDYLKLSSHLKLGIKIN
jgi:hypothetical protein